MSQTATPFGDPSLGDDTAPAPLLREPSIVDTILELDSFLSAEVRLAEKTARFCTRPDIEAQIDALELELEQLVDANGKVRDTDPALGEGRTAYDVATEIQTARHKYAAAMRSVRMRQMDDTSWQAFKEKHSDAFKDDVDLPARRVMYDDLLVESASAPKITPAKLEQLRTKVGSPQIDELVNVAWHVNTQSGVSVPKSLISSAVLRQQARSTS